MSSTAPYPDVWVKEFEPGAAVQTDAQVEKFVRDNVFTFFHPLGTCAMLPKKDGGVVDPQLRVYGVKGLRVVDASVIPMIVSAHIQTGTFWNSRFLLLHADETPAVYGIAERAADILVAEYS